MILSVCITVTFQSKIDDVLQLIQNADPTGENNPDNVEMLQLEGKLDYTSQCTVPKDYRSSMYTVSCIVQFH